MSDSTRRPLPWLALAALAALLLTPVPTLAQAAWLAGANGGSTEFGDYELEAEADSLDDSDTGWSIYGGYRFSPYFALTSGYVDLGALDASAEGDEMPVLSARKQVGPGGFTDKIEADGFVLWGHGVLPLSARAQGFASVGIFFWNQDVTYEDFEGPWQGSSSGSSLAYGLGFNVFLTPAQNSSITVSWQRFPDVGDLDETGHENDVDFFSAGFVLHFGR